jgi:hypothetical protein
VHIGGTDCPDGHIRRLLPDESLTSQNLLLFAVFDKTPPKLIYHSNPITPTNKCMHQK